MAIMRDKLNSVFPGTLFLPSVSVVDTFVHEKLVVGSITALVERWLW